MEKKILVGIEGHVIIDEDALCLYASKQDEYKERIMTKKEKEALTLFQMAQIIKADRWYIDFTAVDAQDVHMQSDQVFEIDGKELDDIIYGDEEECE